MQVFKAFFHIMKKQKMTLLIYSILFILLQWIVYNFMSDDLFTSFEKTKVNIAVMDHDDTPDSRALYDYINQTQNIVSIEDNEEAMVDELFYRNVDYILVIPKGFSENYNSLERTCQSNNVSAYYVEDDINQFLNSLNAYKTAGFDFNKAVELTKQSVSKESEVLLAKATNNETSSRLSSYFRYLPYIYLTLMVTSLGTVLSCFRNKEISMRTKCSSLSITKQNFWLILASLVYGLLIFIIFSGFGIILLGNKYFTATTPLYLLNSLVFLVFGIIFTLMVTVFIDNSNILNLIANLVGLGICFLGGVFVPLEYLNSNILAVAKFLPTYWYVLSVDMLQSFDSSAAQYMTYFKNIGIQCLFVIVLIVITSSISKIKKHG